MNVPHYEKEVEGSRQMTKAIAVVEAGPRLWHSFRTFWPTIESPRFPGARGQITQQDFHAAIKTAREALSVDGAPRLRNISRVKLGVALLGIGHNEEALREL